MTLEEKSRLSYYKRIADISSHQNIELVQHVENNKVFVKKTQSIYDREVYEKIKNSSSAFFPRIQECLEENGELILIESYISGNTLQEILDCEGVCSVEQTAEYLIQVCDGLKILHSQTPPIIHRDIKPSNLMVTEDGQVKMIDCNAAREYVDGKTTDTVLVGTRGFAAPEQYGCRQTDQRTDIYAMGVLTNVLLTGNLPTEKRVTGKVGNIIEKCIQMDPDRRYKNVDELKKAWNNLKRELQKANGESMEDSKKYNRLPGFRSGVWWKMLLASMSYLSLSGLIFQTNFEKNNIPMQGFGLWANRITMFVMIAGWILLSGNFCKIQDTIPFPRKNIILKMIALVGYCVLWGILLIFLLAALGM